MSVAVIVSLCTLGLAAYWAYAHRTMVYSIPCGYRQTFFIASNDSEGTAIKRTDFWHYQFRVDGDGLLRTPGNAIVASWLDSDIIERCGPDRATDVDWNYTVGTRYRDDGSKLFDYVCYYPLDLQYNPCVSIVERIYLERTAKPSTNGSARQGS